MSSEGPGDGGSGGPQSAYHRHHHYQPAQQSSGNQATAPAATIAGSSSSSSRHHEPTNQRFSSLIHDSEVFLTKLREFKPQSLGCLEARRKSSSTLIFPSPQQACMGPPKCPRYPHNVKPTPGYWIECHGPGVLAASSGTKSVSSSGQQQQAAASSSGGPDDRVQNEPDDHQQQAIPGGTTSSGVPPITSIATHDKELAHEQSGARPVQAGGFMGTDSTGLGGGPGGQAETVMASSRRRPSHDHQGGEQMVVSTSLQQLAEQLDRSAAIEDELQSFGRMGAGVAGDGTRTGGAGGGIGRQSGSSGSTRRRMNKRTMTRDDIDLHKSRRGTPNITITEPSFNQSTTSPFSTNSGDSAAVSQQAATGDHQQPVSRQRSGPSSSSCSTGDNEPQTNNELEKQQHSAKFQIPRYTWSEQQQQQQQQQTDNDRTRAQVGARSDSMERQDSSESGDSFGPSDQLPQQQHRPHHHHHHLQHHRPHQQEQKQPPQQQQQPPHQHQQSHHRPSIIREDIDSESELAPTDSGQGQKEFYCSLSTTQFTKKPFQTHHHHQEHQQQQQQQHSSEMQAQVIQQQQQQQQQPQESFEQFRDSSLELISFEEENYEKHYYGREHWNYFTNDEMLGPVMLSLKQEVNNQRDHFHVLLRTVSYTLHGTIPASTICADRYDREAIVRELSEIAKLKPPLMLGQLPSTPDELLKLDHIFIKTELKVGVIYIKQGQEESEEAILGNKEESPLFTEFLDLLGDRITLKGFDRYKGGLDTVHNLTGTESVYTMWRNIEIMFHVSTMLPHEENDPQKLQKKRHIGNDIVCVAFIESDDTLFWPGCIKSYFLHTFIAVRTSPKPLKEGELRKYSVSCVCRNEVQYAFRPYLVERDEFFKSDYFREWLLVKIVNGERASYSAPKFARMQDRTRSQLLEDIITNLANHLVTGQIPKPYRRGSWRPLGHTRASSPLEDSMKDYFEDYDQLAKDFCNAFCGPNKSVLCDVAFKVKDADGSFKLVHGVRAILAIRSRTFLEMLYGFVPPGASSTGLQSQTNLRAIEMKALSGESSSSGGALKEIGGSFGEHNTKGLLAKRGSVGTDPGRKIGEKERRQSMLPNLSKSVSQKANYLTVPNAAGAGGAGGTGTGGGGGSGAGAGGMIKNAFNRLVSGNWSGWSGNIKSYKGEPMHIKVDQNKTKVDLNSLAICKEIAKIDSDKLAQTEFEIKEFDYETFQQTIEYIHNGQCKLSYETIPGLICAAEHYDLPDLLHACFHHANTHMRLSAAPQMMNSLYQNSCFYITAMQLLDSIYEYIDPHGNEFFSRTEYLDLYESVFTSLLCRKTLQVSELKKFQAMDGWARRQVANKLQQQQTKQQLQRKQSAEQQQQQQEHKQQPTTMAAGVTGSGSMGDQHQANVGEQQAITTAAGTSASVETLDQQQQQQQQQQTTELFDHQEYKNLMLRLNKDINIKLDKISNEDLVKTVLPTRVFSNEKVFEVMADESRNDY